MLMVSLSSSLPIRVLLRRSLDDPSPFANGGRGATQFGCDRPVRESRLSMKQLADLITQGLVDSFLPTLFRVRSDYPVLSPVHHRWWCVSTFVPTVHSLGVSSVHTFMVFPIHLDTESRHHLLQRGQVVVQGGHFLLFLLEPSTCGRPHDTLHDTQTKLIKRDHL